jgi:hypothetical protein
LQQLAKAEFAYSKIAATHTGLSRLFIVANFKAIFQLAADRRFDLIIFVQFE